MWVCLRVCVHVCVPSLCFRSSCWQMRICWCHESPDSSCADLSVMFHVVFVCHFMLRLLFVCVLMCTSVFFFGCRKLCIFLTFCYFLCQPNSMPPPNGYSINSARSNEREDTERLIENNTGVLVFVAHLEGVQLRFKISCMPKLTRILFQLCFYVKLKMMGLFIRWKISPTW